MVLSKRSRSISVDLRRSPSISVVRNRLESQVGQAWKMCNFAGYKFSTMTNIKYVEISNFKSIRHLKLEECRRINLLIGYPNVGKSNIIEALGLFSSPFLERNEDLHKLVRFEYEQELFYKSMVNEFTVETNLHKIHARVPNIYDNVSMWDWNSNVLKYKFHENTRWKSAKNPLLLPPFGENIMDTLSFNQNADDIKKWIKKELNGDKLELVFDRTSGCMKIQGRLSEDEVFTLPYSSLPIPCNALSSTKPRLPRTKIRCCFLKNPKRTLSRRI